MQEFLLASVKKLVISCEDEKVWKFNKMGIKCGTFEIFIFSLFHYGFPASECNKISFLEQIKKKEQIKKCSK